VREDIRNQGDEFRASLLFLGSTIFLMDGLHLAIIGYWRDTIRKRVYSLQWLKRDNTVLLLYFTHIPTSV